MMTALETQKASEKWLKDNGQYIPNPATWLNQRRWEDEPMWIEPETPSRTTEQIYADLQVKKKSG